MAEAIQEALSIVTIAQQEVNKLLGGPQHVHNLLGINNHFQMIKNRMIHMGGILEPKKEAQRGPYGPIKKFMGVPVDRPAKFNPKDVAVEDADKIAFRAKVEKLYATLPTMPSNAILNSYTIPEDVLVLRGVAKRAKVKDYDTRELSVPFIEDIKLGIEIRNEEIAKQAEIDARLAEQDAKRMLNDLDEEDDEIEEVEDDLVLQERFTQPIMITKEMIAADPDLKKLKAKPGQLLATDANGAKSIIVP